MKCVSSTHKSNTNNANSFPAQRDIERTHTSPKEHSSKGVLFWTTISCLYWLGTYVNKSRPQKSRASNLPKPGLRQGRRRPRMLSVSYSLVVTKRAHINIAGRVWILSSYQVRRFIFNWGTMRQNWEGRQPLVSGLELNQYVRWPMSRYSFLLEP